MSLFGAFLPPERSESSPACGFHGDLARCGDFSRVAWRSDGGEAERRIYPWGSCRTYRLQQPSGTKRCHNFTSTEIECGG
jgi:hypothetical protein